MTDTRRRELEQRLLRTGAAEDASALLRERLRAGEVRIEGLELAAYLGHGPAAVALGAAAPDALHPDHLPGHGVALAQITAATSGYLSHAARWGETAVMRIAIAAALHAREVWARVGRDRGRADQADACIRAAERWVLSDERGRRHGLVGPWPEDEDALARVLAGLFDIAAASRSPPDSRERALANYLARTLAAATRVWTGGRDAHRSEGEALLARVRADVVPWALGEPDPIGLRLVSSARGG